MIRLAEMWMWFKRPRCLGCQWARAAVIFKKKARVEWRFLRFPSMMRDEDSKPLTAVMRTDLGWHLCIDGPFDYSHNLSHGDR